jgi:hypothetical protein
VPRRHRRPEVRRDEPQVAPSVPIADSNSQAQQSLPPPNREPPSLLSLAEAGAAPVAQRPFLQRSAAEKMRVMADVMDQGRGMLDANGVSPQVERRIAATVPQELSSNDARRGLGSSFLRQARGLQQTMKGVDPNDPVATAKATARLTEEQRFLRDRVQAGELDLSTLPDDLSRTPAALRDQVTEAGIALRTSQYGEMSDLAARSRTEKLSKEDAARLSHLRGINGMGMRYNGYDPTMGDLAGMTPGRFGEIFAEGNSRFEPVQYRRLRDSYTRNRTAHDQAAAAYAADPKRKPPSETITASAGIGDFDVNPTGQARLAQDFDLVADMATSYGAGQIMGGYAAQPYWQGRSRGERLPAVREADGTSRATTLDELKASGTRMEPTVDDVRPMLGLVQMKGIDLGGSPTVPQWISAYNGNPNPAQRQQYTNSLNDNGALYDAAKAARRDTNG